MTKTLLTMLLAVILLISCTVIEQNTVKKTFEEFDCLVCVTQEKLKSESPSVLDSEGLFDFWFEKKRLLHVWIPHAEIKEIDLWISECSAYTKLGMFNEAITKLDVLKMLSKQLPHNFSLKIENLF